MTEKVFKQTKNRNKQLVGIQKLVQNRGKGLEILKKIEMLEVKISVNSAIKSPSDRLEYEKSGIQEFKTMWKKWIFFKRHFLKKSMSGICEIFGIS